MIAQQEDVRDSIGPSEEEGFYRNGGKIYIKPSKRGTFTAAAKKRGMGVQAFARKVLANKENYSSAMVKKANFARNSSKWKHWDGGWTEDAPIENISGDGGPNTGFNFLSNMAQFQATEPLVQNSTYGFDTYGTSSKENKFDWGSTLRTAGSLAPALYNIGQGIWGKVDTLDPYGYQVRTKYAYPKQNITPVISDIRSQGAMARRMAGSDMASQIAATASTQEALSDVYTRKQAIEDQRFMEAQRYGMMAEQFNVANRLGIDQYNMQAQAAKENMLGEGISQLGTVASGYGQEILQKRWLDQMGTMYDKYLAEGKISNEEYLKKLEELQKSKTDNQDGTSCAGGRYVST